MRWILALLSLGSAPLTAQESLLKNGGFEKGRDGVASSWQQVYPPGIQQPAPTFGQPEEGAHSGSAYVTLETQRPGGYSSFTQRVRGDRKANVAQLSAWVRIDEIAKDSSASLLLMFIDSKGDMLSMHKSPQLDKTSDWVLLELEASVPDGAAEWMVRCGINGQGRIAFDDVELIGQKLSGDMIATELAVHHGTWILRTPQSERAAWIDLSIPFPFEGQSPLALRVISDPPDMVARLEIYEERENRPLRVVLNKTERGAVVRLRVETLTMVGDRPISDGVGIKLAKASAVPKKMRQHLKSAPGVDSEVEEVQDAASKFDRSDLASLMADVRDYMNLKLKYSIGGNQGAVECLEKGGAVCTGYANVAAALLIAADVPTRILACTQLSGRLQEHYIVQAWTPDLGWSRMESTMAQFPWQDTNNLIVRVVYPDSFRSNGNVPLFVTTGGGGTGGIDMDPSDTCWQGADPVKSLLITKKGFENLETIARKNFDAMIKRSVKGSFVSFAPDAKQLKKLKLDDRSQRLLDAVKTWQQPD